MRRLAFLVALGLFAPQLALADGANDDKPRCEPIAPGKVGFHVEKQGGRKVVVLHPKIDVCAKPPRPSVAIVPVAKQINYEWEDLKQDFLPKVQASVTKAPF